MIASGDECRWHLGGEARMLLNILRRPGHPPTSKRQWCHGQKPPHSVAPESESPALGTFFISKKTMEHPLRKVFMRLELR